MPRFHFDVLDGGRVTHDSLGIEYDGLEMALAEAVAGARNLVAHGIMRNEDLSGQVFVIRDENGDRLATVPFRDTLPGRLKG